MSTMRTPSPSGSTMTGFRSSETSLSPSAQHMAATRTSTSERGFHVGRGAPSEAGKQLGGLEPADHGAGAFRVRAGQLKRNVAQQLHEHAAEPHHDRRSEPAVTVHADMVSTTSPDLPPALHHALHEHPRAARPRGEGSDAFKLAPCRREFRAGAEVELDEASLGLVRDVGEAAFRATG